MDAPISGGPVKAEAGTLTIMCGGPKSIFERVQPVLQCMGTNVRHMGPHGAGTATKLVGPVGCIACKRGNGIMYVHASHNALTAWLVHAESCNVG